MKDNKNFEDNLLEIFILIEDNNEKSTTKAIDLFHLLYNKETGENISKKQANIEMRKSYNKFQQ